MLHINGNSLVQFYVPDKEIEWPNFLFDIPPQQQILINKAYQIIQESCNVFTYLVYHISTITTHWKLSIPVRARVIIDTNYPTILDIARAFDNHNEWSPSINSHFFAASSSKEHLLAADIPTADLKKCCMRSLEHVCQSLFEVHVSLFDMNELIDFLGATDETTTSPYTSTLEILVNHIVALFSFCDKIKKHEFFCLFSHLLGNKKNHLNHFFFFLF